jgi:hypothetical protein
MQFRVKKLMTRWSGNEKLIQNLVGKPVGNLRLDRRFILKLILEKQV